MGRYVALVAVTVLVVILIILVGVTFALMANLIEHFVMYPVYYCPRVRISQLYPEIKTGDIILYASAAQGFVNGIVTHTYFSHCGMAIRDEAPPDAAPPDAGPPDAGAPKKGAPEEEDPLPMVYVSEGQPGTKFMPAPGGGFARMRAGTATVPFLARLKYYTGVCYIMRLSRPLAPDREAAVKAAARAPHPYSTLTEFVAEMFVGGGGSRHCFQHVAHLTRLAGLVRGPFPGLVEVCREVCDMYRRGLPDGYRYEPPVQIVYDIDC